MNSWCRSRNRSVKFIYIYCDHPMNHTTPHTHKYVKQSKWNSVAKSVEQAVEVNTNTESLKWQVVVGIADHCQWHKLANRNDQIQWCTDKQSVHLASYCVWKQLPANANHGFCLHFGAYLWVVTAIYLIKCILAFTIRCRLRSNKIQSQK